MFPFKLFRFFRIPGGRKELPAGIECGVRTEPEAVHEIKVRAEGREGMGRAADEGGKDAVILEPVHPKCKGRRGEAHREQKEEKDKREQDLGLVFGRPASMGIKGQEDFHSLIGIKEAELLPGFPEFGMEPDFFRRIKINFGKVEKTFVILHGLPVFDHSAEPPCK